MVNKNHTRRKVLQTTGATLIGLSGIATAKQGGTSGDGTSEKSGLQIATSTTPIKTVKLPVQGNNMVNIGNSVGYFGSQQVDTWVNGEVKTRWRHLFEASMSGKTEGGYYNFGRQSFKAEFSGGAEHNSSPSAGAATWPNPPFGNFTGVVKGVIKACLAAESTVASVVLTEDDIMDAYGKKNFGTVASDEISFVGDYQDYLRVKGSHSVHFAADGVPGQTGIVDITSSATDAGDGEVVAGTITADIMDDAYSFEQASIQDSSVTLRDTFDAMSKKQLARRGVKRINPSEVTTEIAQKSRFDLSKNRPTYIKSFDMNFEFDAVNGSVISPSITKN